MPTPDGTPSDTELLYAALEWFSKRLRVHLPGTVDAVHLDEAGHVKAVDVRVDVGEYRKSGGKEVPDVDPILPNLPVQWMGGGGARATFPLARGDSGLLLFADKGLDEWNANAQGQVLARALRRHDLADAVFAPGLRRLAVPWAGARTDAVTLGYETSAAGEPMQIHVTPGGIALGEASPVDAALLGTTYRSAEGSMNTSLSAQLTAAATALSAAGVDAVLLAAAPAAAGFLATAGTALATAATAISAFETGASTFLSTAVKLKK